MISYYNDEELKKMREDVLHWIETREKRKLIKIKEKIKQGETGGQTPMDKKPEYEVISLAGQKTKHYVRSVKYKKSSLFIAFTLFLFFILLIVIFQLYISGYSNFFINPIVKVIPIPIMKVEGRLIPYYHYVTMYEGLRIAAGKRYSHEVLKNKTLEKLMDKERHIALAKKYNIKLNSDDIKDSLNAIIYEAGSKERFYTFIMRNYGWKENDFIQNILIPYLLKRKILLFLKEDGRFEDYFTEIQRIKVKVLIW